MTALLCLLVENLFTNNHFSITDGHSIVRDSFIFKGWFENNIDNIFVRELYLQDCLMPTN